MLAGTMHPILETFSGIVSGVARQVLRGILFLTPDLYAAESQAGRFLSGKDIQIHSILGGLLVLYVCGMLLYLLRRKEA